MTHPVSSQIKPYSIELDAGTYHWCACGRSKKQPFCDGSHQQTDITPIEFKVKNKETVWLCGCRQSVNKPMCDGSHKNLSNQE